MLQVILLMSKNNRKHDPVIPISGYTEEEVVDTIYSVANRLSSRYKFGYHGRDDIVQQASLIAIKCLNKNKYDHSHPLENFLYVHLRNRLFNYRRDNFERLSKPCKNCEFLCSVEENDNECLAFENREDCKAYFGWDNRNQSKKNLMSPIPMDTVRDENEDNMSLTSMSAEQITEDNEISSYIDKHLNIKFRPDYIKLIYGHKIPKGKLEALSEEIYGLLDSFDLGKM